EHAKRSDWVWAEVGEAPLALASVHLRQLVQAITAGLPSGDWHAMADGYLLHGWVADASAWKALDAVRDMRDFLAVTAALRAVYLPWLEDLANRVVSAASTYPNPSPIDCMVLAAESGTVLLFVDGLRCDLG